ncbi:MAG: hypothetical protein Q7U74_07685, partial [Saprospiraceae bacterium]|nr:hypothetical protein [Saprospiraceae bacterium]
RALDADGSRQDDNAWLLGRASKRPHLKKTPAPGSIQNFQGLALIFIEVTLFKKVSLLSTEPVFSVIQNSG